MHPLTTAAEQIDASTTDTGASNAAVLNLEEVRSDVDVVTDVSGSATLTIEVSATGEFSGEEHEADTVSLNAGVDFRQYDFAYQHIRGYVDANLTELELVARGV
jgi:hypothetical protein